MRLDALVHKVQLWLPIAGLVATVFCQIQWILRWDRFLLTVIVVGLGALTMLVDACLRYGARTAAGYGVLVVTVSWLIEFIGINSARPFGAYHYATRVSYSSCMSHHLCSDVQVATHSVLQIGGVPVIVPIAWLMMAYPAFLVGQTLGRSVWGRWGLASIALASWDVFLDPQFLLDRNLIATTNSPDAPAAGWWVWHNPEPHLAGIPHIPLSNFAGWLIAAAAIQVLGIRLLRSTTPVKTELPPVPMLFYVWTWLGGVIANLFYLNWPAVAAWGAATMGVIAVPLLAHMIRERRTYSLLSTLPSALSAIKSSNES